MDVAHHGHDQLLIIHMTIRVMWVYSSSRVHCSSTSMQLTWEVSVTWTKRAERRKGFATKTQKTEETFQLPNMQLPFKNGAIWGKSNMAFMCTPRESHNH
ncbi:hypothetical protein ACLB2K_020444 [Fragaria x ananassa]